LVYCVGPGGATSTVKVSILAMVSKWEKLKSDKEEERKKNQRVGERVKSFSSKATRLDALERPILLSLRALFLLRKPKSYS
jgi:hypothetical protein